MFIPPFDHFFLMKRDMDSGPMAIVDPKDGTTGTVDDTTITDTSFGHRFIGVWIVIGLAVIALVLWICLAKWPRRMLRRLGLTCLPEPPSKKGNAGIVEEEGESKQTRVSFQPSPDSHTNKNTELTQSWSRSTEASVDPRYPAVK